MASSKWGQIKIQEDPLFGSRHAITKFCCDPFCVVSGASGRALPRCARRVPCTDLAARARACAFGMRSGASTEVSQGGKSLQRTLLGCGDF